MFEILESKFGVTKVKYLITLINASRDGLLETEMIELLQISKIVEGIFGYTFIKLLLSISLLNKDPLQNSGPIFVGSWAHS